MAIGEMAPIRVKKCHVSSMHGFFSFLSSSPPQLLSLAVRVALFILQVTLAVVEN